MQHTINDSFMNPDLWGHNKNLSFRIGLKFDEPRADIKEWQINRTNARSRGDKFYQHVIECKYCKSTLRRVYCDSCYDCSERSRTAKKLIDEILKETKDMKFIGCYKGKSK